MKIKVEFSKKEITTIINMFAAANNKIAALTSKTQIVDDGMKKQVIDKFENDEFKNEYHSRAMAVTMDSKEVNFDIKEGAVLDAIEVLGKAATIALPFVNTIVAMVKMIRTGMDSVLNEFANLRNRWTVSDNDKRYHVLYIENEGVKYKVVLSYDGYEKHVYGVYTNNLNDASSKYVDYLLARYHDSLNDISENAFTLTKSEVDELAHQW